MATLVKYWYNAHFLQTPTLNEILDELEKLDEEGIGDECDVIIEPPDVHELTDIQVMKTKETHLVFLEINWKLLLNVNHQKDAEELIRMMMTIMNFNQLLRKKAW